MHRFRPTIEKLEDRRTPALNVLSSGGNLTVTGTPDAVSPGQTVGWNQAVSVTRTTGDFYQVKDGGTTLGTFKVTRDLNLRFDSIDNDVIVDLNGASFQGNMSIDLGQGDRSPSTRNFVTVVGDGGQVHGGVTFSGSSSNESFSLGSEIFYTSFTFNGTTYYFEFLSAPSPVTVRKNVSALGTLVTNSQEDTFQLGDGSVVQGSVSTNRVTYTTILGTVQKDLTAVTHVPGGMGFGMYGTVGGNVYAEGSASTPGYYSYAEIYGTVQGNATVKMTGGLVFATVAGMVGKNFTYESEGKTNSFVDIINWPAFGYAGEVGGMARFNFGSDAGTFNGVTIAAPVGGSVTVHDGAGNLNVLIGSQGIDFDPETGELIFVDLPATIDGGVHINAGNGSNTFTFDGATGSTCGGPVVYNGGSGEDTVSITGKNDFALIAHLGGGDDTVMFAPDARVGSAHIVFGNTGTKTWIPPLVIDFDLWLVNY